MKRVVVEAYNPEDTSPWPPEDALEMLALKLQEIGYRVRKSSNREYASCTADRVKHSVDFVILVES